jgi:hypothetical protein
MIKTVEEPDSVSNQDRHNVQLQLIDQPSRQGLSCDVGTASDGRVAIARGLLGGLDGRRNSLGNEDEFDRMAGPAPEQADDG